MKHANIKYDKYNNKSLIIAVLSSLIVFVLGICEYGLVKKVISFKIVYFIILITISINIFLGVREILKKDYKIEKIFIICAIPLGVIYTLLIPPGIVPDEWVHMQNTFSLSSQLTSHRMDDKVCMRNSEIDLYMQQLKVPNIDYYNYVYNNIFSFSNDNTYSTLDIKAPDLNQIFGYFPSIIGVIFARVLNFGSITTFYIGRISNFIFYLVLSYNAIKKIPFGKVLLFSIMMLPMACHQMCSLSYDVIINASSFLAIAYGMSFVYQSNKVRINDIVAYTLCSILLLANKGSAYAFILVIPILAKYFNPNGEKMARKTKIIIFLIVVIGIIILNYRFLTNNSQVSGIQSVSGEGIVPWSGTPSYTLNFLLTNVLNTLNLFINTFIQKGWWYICTAIGSELGWLSIIMPNWIIDIWLGILLISALAEKSNNEVFTYEHKLLYFFISLGTILLVMFAMALAWTPQGYNVIEGVQGRYYIPIIFLLLICLQNSKIYLKENMIKIILVIIQIMSIFSIYCLIPLVL
ncbi:DUF2142 domain-containing protein [Thomasclavelia cocleata]|uniref:DUF2142 domain-containing protein n=1 Tax=Thomasclavelia cocleata TaxID=69824 RepID=UPI0024948FAD|nr:DUF2142 domain-containing protein [Thomasclavelia cocleata]